MFGILYIESHCVNIFILIHKTTYSIYGKVDIAFLLSLQCPVNIAFTFDSFEIQVVGSIVSAVGGKQSFLGERLDWINPRVAGVNQFMVHLAG